MRWGHEWHMSIHKEAGGGQKSLIKQWTSSYSKLPMDPLPHSPWGKEPVKTREHVTSLCFELNKKSIPVMLKQADIRDWHHSTVHFFQMVTIVKCNLADSQNCHIESDNRCVILCVVKLYLKEVPDHSLVIWPMHVYGLCMIHSIWILLVDSHSALLCSDILLLRCDSTSPECLLYLLWSWPAVGSLSFKQIPTYTNRNKLYVYLWFVN